jgi:hypothetical protein
METDATDADGVDPSEEIGASEVLEESVVPDPAADTPAPALNSALRIVRERYASGEISRDEYIQIRDDLVAELQRHRGCDSEPARTCFAGPVDNALTAR